MEEITRYRCTACGNLTRFDVTETITQKSFHHFSLGGELGIEELKVINRTVERVSCRWCNTDEHVIEYQNGNVMEGPDTE